MAWIAPEDLARGSYPVGHFLEAVGYDDEGGDQGVYLICLVTAVESPTVSGVEFEADFVGSSDSQYAAWARHEGKLRYHLCGCGRGECKKEGTIHIDTARSFSPEALQGPVRTVQVKIPWATRRIFSELQGHLGALGDVPPGQEEPAGLGTPRARSVDRGRVDDEPSLFDGGARDPGAELLRLRSRLLDVKAERDRGQRDREQRDREQRDREERDRQQRDRQQRDREQRDREQRLPSVPAVRIDRGVAEDPRRRAVEPQRRAQLRPALTFAEEGDDKSVELAEPSRRGRPLEGGAYGRAGGDRSFELAEPSRRGRPLEGGAYGRAGDARRDSRNRPGQRRSRSGRDPLRDRYEQGLHAANPSSHSWQDPFARGSKGGGASERQEERRGRSPSDRGDRRRRRSRSRARRTRRTRRRSSGSSSSASSSGFGRRGGGPGGTQQALLAKAKRQPGKLASRMLNKMRALLDHEPVPSSSRELRPAAVHYVHTVSTAPGSLVGWRGQREMLTLAKMLDLMAEGSYGAAADVAAQRLKAIDKAARDGGNWDHAQFLELIPVAETALADRDEEFMAAKEVRLAKKAGLKGSGKDKGAGKGKDKGKTQGKGAQNQNQNRGAPQQNQDAEAPRRRRNRQ